MDFLKMMQAASQMSGKMQEVQDALARQAMGGSAGGGLVTAETDGKGQLKRISLSPEAVNAADIAGLEDLIVLAVQDAQRQAREAAELEMKRVADGLGLGNLPFKLPF